jgi:hypothetical protein
VVGCKKHRVLALEAVRKSIVLLKNGNSLLLLDGSAKSILLIGPSAANVHSLLGNYYGMSSRLVTLFEGLADKIRDKAAISLEYRQVSLMYEPNHVSSREEGGNALADIIFGDISPSGKLPVTFPKSTDQLPPYEDYAMQGAARTVI